MRISDWSSDVCSSDLAMFQEAADDRLHPDIVRHARHARPQAAYAAHDEVDLNPRIAGRIEFFDDRRIDQRIHLRPDRKSVVEGKSVSVRVDLGGRRIIKKKYNNRHSNEISTNK